MSYVVTYVVLEKSQCLRVPTATRGTTLLAKIEGNEEGRISTSHVPELIEQDGQVDDSAGKGFRSQQKGLAASSCFVYEEVALLTACRCGFLSEVKPIVSFSLLSVATPQQ